MYKIYVDNELFCDSSINDLAVMNPVVTLEANTAGQFTFTIPVTHPYYDNITRLTSVVEVYRENKMVFRGFVSGDEKDLWNNRAITCEGDLSYLNDSILRPWKWQGETVLSLISAYIYGYWNGSVYFDGHNDQVEPRKRFEIGTVTVTDPNNYIYCFTNMNSTMAEIKEDLIDDLGGYIRVRRQNNLNYIDYIREEDFPTASQTIELGVNLINYKSNIDDIDLCTRVIPLGALLEEQTIEGLDTRLTIEGQPVSSTHLHTSDDYLQSTSAINNFGIITKTVTFDDVTTPSKLATKGNKYLSQNQFENLVIEVSAVDLGLIDSDVDTWELLQKIRVKSEVHGLDAYFPLTKMVLNLANPENDTFTLGTKSKLKTSLTAKTSEASEVTKKIVNSMNQPAWLAQAQQNALNMLLDETQGGHVIFEYHKDSNNQPDYIESINICDATTIANSKKRWVWCQNGLGYMYRSSTSANWSGWDEETQTSNFCAITADGKINADVITAGTLIGREINNGNGTFHVYQNGTVDASKMNITGGNISIATNDYTAPKLTISYVSNFAKVMAKGMEVWGDGYHSQLDSQGLSLTSDSQNINMVRCDVIGSPSTGDSGSVFIRNYSNRRINLSTDNGYAQIECRYGSAYSLINDSKIEISGDLNVHGSKNRVVATDNYGNVLFNAYETPRPTFADEGHGKLDENGVCYIYLDDVFLETIDQTHRYRVFLTKYGQGDIWVEEVEKTWFVVCGTSNLEFDWKVDCIQRDYNYANMEKHEKQNKNEEINYDSLANQYLTQYEREVLTDESNY